MALQGVCFFVLALIHNACGHGFLAANPKIKVLSVRDELLGAISDVLGLGHGINARHLAQIRLSLTPLFQSLPKNRKGHLSKAVMRYAVQRYFSQQYGWIMKGFEPHAATDNATNSTADEHILEDKVPDFLRELLEQKLWHGGFALDDAVVMVATLERLIMDEVVAGVEMAFDLNEIEATQGLSRDSFLEVVSSYLITEILQSSAAGADAHWVKKRNIASSYPHWAETFRFIVDIAFNDDFEHKHAHNLFTDQVYRFEDAVRVSQRLSEEFGPFSTHECDLMKFSLSTMDTQETGRVRMSDFYSKAQGGSWQFEEGFEYLRQVGAIDESSSHLGAQVIIPNYIAGVNNCITSKHYYSICCLNACDAVYQHLEAKISAAYALPAEVVAVAEDLRHMADRKNLTESLRTQLDSIAELHNGKIPLHGRLLGQWLHFAFPQDCPYPHMIGTTNPQSPAQYEKAAGEGAVDATSEEVERFLTAESAQLAPSPEAGALMWNFQEVLLDTATPFDDAYALGKLRPFLRVVAFLGMIVYSAVWLINESRSLLHCVRPEVKAFQYEV